jgi:hypothetical protein
MSTNINILIDPLILSVNARVRQEVARNNNLEKEADAKKEREAKSKIKDKNLLAGPDSDYKDKRLPPRPEPAASRRPKRDRPGLGFALSNYRSDFDSTYTYCNERYLELNPGVPITIAPTMTDYPGRWLTTWEGQELKVARMNLVSNHCGYLVDQSPPNNADSFQDQRIIVSSNFKDERYLHVRVEAKAGKSKAWQDYLEDFFKDRRPYSLYVGGDSTFRIGANSYNAVVTSTYDHNLTEGDVLYVESNFFFDNGFTTVGEIISNKKFTLVSDRPGYYPISNLDLPIEFVEESPLLAPQIGQILLANGTFGAFPNTFSQDSCAKASPVIFYRDPNTPDNNSDLSFFDKGEYAFMVIKLAPGNRSFTFWCTFVYNAFRNGYVEFRFQLSKSPDPFFS